jgi:hypothetical protein
MCERELNTVAVGQIFETRGECPYASRESLVAHARDLPEEFTFQANLS